MEITQYSHLLLLINPNAYYSRTYNQIQINRVCVCVYAREYLGLSDACKEETATGLTAETWRNLQTITRFLSLKFSYAITHIICI